MVWMQLYFVYETRGQFHSMCFCWKCKKLLELTVFFSLRGSGRLKAVHIMLVKLTPGGSTQGQNIQWQVIDNYLWWLTATTPAAATRGGRRGSGCRSRSRSCLFIFMRASFALLLFVSLFRLVLGSIKNRFLWRLCQKKQDSSKMI